MTFVRLDGRADVRRREHREDQCLHNADEHAEREPDHRRDRRTVPEELQQDVNQNLTRQDVAEKTERQRNRLRNLLDMLMMMNGATGWNEMRHIVHPLYRQSQDVHQ